MSNEVILSCRQLAKTYYEGQVEVHVFSDINLTIQAGERVAIMGSSGSGKSTLLHLLGGLDKPTSGEVWLKNQNLSLLNEVTRCQIRNEELGFIYQLHHLLPEFTVLENVCMPMLLQKKRLLADIYERAGYLLDRVGLSHRLSHKVSQLSGGERQRTAIVRALMNHPSCVLADEPTGNLDRQTAKHVYETMLRLNREFNTSFIIVTHDQQLAKAMDRVLVLMDGCLIPTVV